MCYLYFFCLHCLINIHIFDYPDSRLSGLFTLVPPSPDNRGSTVPEYFPLDEYTVESRFFEYSIIRNSRVFEPKVVYLGFASVKHCNFTSDFSNARFLETPDISN